MINSAIKYLTFIFFILFPILYLPITADAYEFNKMALLFSFSFVLLLLYLIKSAHERKFVIGRSSFSALLLFLAGVTLISALLQSPNPVVALVTPLSTSTIISGVLLYFLLTSIDSIDISKITPILFFDASLIAVYAILLNAGILPGGFYTPAGSLLSTALFLFSIFVFMTGNLLNNIQHKKTMPSILNFAAIILIGIAAIIITQQLFGDKSPVLLPFQFGWVTFLEVLKNIKTFALGVGPSNFITAFTLTKPAAFNHIPQWNFIFTSSSSFLLNLGTEIGMFAVISYLLIFFKSIKLLFPVQNNKALFPFRLTLAVILILQIILPSSMNLFIFTILLLAICAERKEKIEIKTAKLGVFSYLFILPFLILTGIVFYFGYRFYLADIYFKLSLDHLLNKEGTKVYKNQDKAIQLNPYLDRYHAAFSQTNLSLANALASKKELTDTDKQSIPNLVKQSIDHAQTAVNLYKTNVVNWDNLGKIYISLIGYAQGADEWAASSLIQKINLDPVNPNGYYTLGVLNFNRKKYDEAEKLLRQAIVLKPDYANTHYQLALIYKTENKYKEAQNELKTTLSFLKADSPEANIVKKELADLASQPTAPTLNQTLESESGTSAVPAIPKTFPTISIVQAPVKL